VQSLRRGLGEAAGGGVMKRACIPLLSLCLALTASAAFSATSKTVPGGGDLVFSPPDMPEMVQAKAEARRTLPLFWRWLSQQKPDQPGFIVKVGFPITQPVKSVEFMWVNNLKRDGDKVTGKLDQVPSFRPDLKYTQTVSFKESQIVDWAIRYQGRQYGHFTTRVLIKGHPKEEAEFKKILSDDPYPPGFK
jgi:uncharacterized protein YegJ (DUF2314 family)